MVSLQDCSDRHRASFNVALACMVFLENRARILRAAYTIVKRFSIHQPKIYFGVQFACDTRTRMLAAGRGNRGPQASDVYLSGIAIGRIGDAVAPFILSGVAMNRNSYTASFARSSSHMASSSDTPCSACR